MRVAVLLATAALLASTPARAHGASRGLHLHLHPDRASPGAPIEIDADAALTVSRLKIGFVGGEATVIEPKTPAKRVVASVAVPKTAKPGTTINVMAEATTTEGRLFRAAAIVGVIAAEPAGATPGAPPQ